MTDKDGKKLKLGSVIALQKAGRDKYTLKGKVIEIGETHIRMRAYSTGGIYFAQAHEIKRITFKPKERWEDAF